MAIELITYKGQEIVFIDYTNCKKPEETIAVVNEAERVIMAYAQQALVLVDVTGAPGSSEYMARAKEVSQKVNHKVAKRAIVGITGLKKVLFQGYSRIIKGNNRLFDTRAEAMDFLAAV